MRHVTRERDASYAKITEREFLRTLSLTRAGRSHGYTTTWSPLANGARPRRARGSRDERTVNFSNFFSQLLHRHALQVSIDKELATPPPRLLKRKPITAIREAAAPASASPARYNPGHPSLRPETALNYTRCAGGLRPGSLRVDARPSPAFEPSATPKGALRLRLRVKRSP